MEKLISVNECLKILNISRTTLYRLINGGKITPLKIGKKTLFKESEINRFITSLEKDKDQ